MATNGDTSAVAATTATTVVQPQPQPQSETQKQPDASTPRPDNPRVSISKDTLCRLLEAIAATPCSHLRAALAPPVLNRSLAVVHSATLPEAPPDPALASRVANLERTAAQLALTVAEQRARTLAVIRASISESTAPITAALLAEPPVTTTVAEHHGDGPNDQQQQHRQQDLEVRKTSVNLAKTALAGGPAVAAAIKKASADARRNRRRADNLRDVLRIVNDNAGAREAIADRNVTADLTRLLSDSKRAAAARVGVNGDGDAGGSNDDSDWTIRGGQAVARSGGGDDEDDYDGSGGELGSPIPTLRPPGETEYDEFVLSPFVTPRSKTRRRLLGSGMSHMPR